VGCQVRGSRGIPRAAFPWARLSRQLPSPESSQSRGHGAQPKPELWLMLGGDWCHQCHPPWGHWSSPTGWVLEPAGSRTPERWRSCGHGDRGEPLPGQALEPRGTAGCGQVPALRGAAPVLGEARPAPRGCCEGAGPFWGGGGKRWGCPGHGAERGRAWEPP